LRPRTAGAIRAGTAWAGAGNVIQHASTSTVGDAALNGSRWGTISFAIDAIGTRSIVIAAQVEAGNLAPSPGGRIRGQQPPLPNVFRFHVFVHLRHDHRGDSNLLVEQRRSTDITGWRIGGGPAGVVAFRMTCYNLSLSASAIPEPGTSTALFGFPALGFRGLATTKCGADLIAVRRGSKTQARASASRFLTRRVGAKRNSHASPKRKTRAWSSKRTEGSNPPLLRSRASQTVVISLQT
jgi:hypothetical protein